MPIGNDAVSKVNIYRIPAWQSRCVEIFFTGLFLLWVWGMWVYRSDQLKGYEKILVLVFLFGPAGLFVWGIKRTHVRIDNTGMTILGLFNMSALSVKWKDVDDVLCSERLICVRDSNGKEIKVFNSEFLGFEPFEDLTRNVLKYTRAQLDELRRQAPDRMVVSYPPLSALTWIGYAVPLAIGVALALVRFRGSMTFQITYISGVLILLAPFFVRDWLKTRQTLTLSEEGLQCSGIWPQVEIRWEEIAEILIKEPMSIGYGSVVVKSKDGKRTLAIPRSIKKSGTILELIEKRSGVAPSEGYFDL